MTMIDSMPDAKPKTQRRRRFTARDRKRLLSQYRRSGQGAVRFCQEHDVCPSSLWRWLARERRSSGEAASSGGDLVEIPMAALRAQQTVGAAVSMQIADVARLDVAVGTDPEWLGALVRALTPARP
jgi:transposase-like protein